MRTLARFAARADWCRNVLGINPASHARILEMLSRVVCRHPEHSDQVDASLDALLAQGRAALLRDSEPRNVRRCPQRAQRPTEAVSDPMELMASLPVERGRWDETATDFQRRDAAAVLDLMGPPFTFITRPRGGRKSTDAAALCVALHMTTAPPGATSFVVAADAEQAGIVLERAFLPAGRSPAQVHQGRGPPGRVPDRWRADLVRRRATSRRGIELRPEALPGDRRRAVGLADSANAKGLWSAVVSAMPKIEGSKLVVVTSGRCARPLVGHRARARPHLCAVAGSRNAGGAAMDQSPVLAEQRSLLDGLGIRPAP